MSEPFSEDEWTTCLRILRVLAKDPTLAPDLEALERSAAFITKRARKARRKESSAKRKGHDRNVVEQLLVQREQNSVQAPPIADDDLKLQAATRSCYVCHARYRELHPRYHQLCPDCGKLNEEKRLQRADLRGRRALVTGGRIKIGFETALRLLRDGAEVVVTSRRADEAHAAFARQPDSASFLERLRSVSLDMRNIESVLAFANEFEKRFGALDILVNNAAQSVVRPEGIDDAAQDLRDQNSWMLALEEVAPTELSDAFNVNAVAPLLLTGRLKRAMLNSKFEQRFVINVVGLDGRFGSTYKSPKHPHINASKAGLNMMTRTCAQEWQLERIYMCSVDPGWVSHEAGYEVRVRAREKGFVPPLDSADGAARIYDPIVMGLRGQPCSGVLLKDFVPASW
jgi:NAD(P)-dependent dehydrogenase (short-subunit alcohol dehydrogenase family)